MLRVSLVWGRQWRSRSSILALSAAATLLVLGSGAFASVRAIGVGESGSSAAATAREVLGAASAGTRLHLSQAELRGSKAAAAAHRRWLRWLASPQARAARARSRTAFRGLSAAVAQRLFVREFGSQLGAFGASPAASVAAGGRVLWYENDYTAVVLDRRGRRMVERSNVPLRADGHPVDLLLQPTGGGFASVRSPDGLSIAGSLSGGVTLADGIGFSLAGRDVPGQLGAHNTVFFGDARTDTDASVTPTAGGVDLSAVLRSRNSPQTLRYQVQLPPGATLAATGQGAVVERGGKPVLLISAPSATDAQGSLVPVSMKLDGSALVLSINHRHRDVAYPILVDPQVTLTSKTPGWTFSNYAVFLESGDAGGRAATSVRRTIGASGVNGARTRASVGRDSRTRRRALGRSGDTSGWCYFSGPQPGEIVVPSGEFNWDDCNTGGNWMDGAWTWSANAAGFGELTDLQLNNVSYTYDASNTSPPGWSVYTNGDISSTCSEQDGTDAPNGVPQSMEWQGSDCGNQLSVILSSWGNSTGPATFNVGSMLATAPYQPPPPPPTTTFVSGGGPQNADPNWTTCNSGSDPVNCATGDLYSTRTDLSLADRDLPFAITRTYDAQDAVAQTSPGVFGYGWSASFTDHLAWDSLGPNVPSVSVVQSNGSQIPFLVANGPTFTPAYPYIQATLTENADGTLSYVLPDQQTETFNQSSGQLLNESDRFGNTLTLAYDSSGNLTSISDAAGRTIALTHNSDGTVSSASGPAGTVRYGYDGNGNLTSVTDLDGGTWTYGYDSSHRMTSETDPRGNTIQTAYDSSNRVVSQTDAMGRQWSWSYPSSNETIVTNPGGDQVDEQFQNDLPVSVTRGYGSGSASTKTMAYDQNLNLAVVTDGDGNTWSYSYDSSGNRTYQRDPDGNVTTWTYDGTHDVTSMTDPDGEVTNYQYQSGELTSVSRWLAQSSQSQTTSYGYDGSGDMTSMTDANGHTWKYGYDAYGDRISSTAPGGEETSWSYDQNGYLTSMVSPAGNTAGANPSQYTTSYTNDPYGRATLIVNPLGDESKTAYDTDGNEVSSTDANGNTTTYSYDADNELVRVTRPDGTTLSNGYDSDGQLTSQTDGAGKTTSYGYDPLGDLVSTTDPAGRTTTNAFDPAGNLISVTDPQGRTTSYGYDGAGERTSVTYSDGKTPNVSYTYDGDGHRTSMTDGTGTTTYAYDAIGRLISQTNGAGQQVSYGYDLDNHLTSITYPNGKTVTRAYDSDGQLTSVTDWLGNKTSFAYDADSNPTSTSFPTATGEADSRTYNAADQLTSIDMTQGSSTLASFGYARNANGQPQTLTATGVGPSSESYSYTSLNQLASVSGTSYAYDPADNLTQTASQATLAYDAANEVTGLSEGGQTASFSYDQEGDRTQSAIPGVGRFSESYDQADDLTSVSSSGLGATLTGGASFTLVLGEDGLISAAGVNNDGQLGTGTNTNSSVPVQIPGLAHVTAVAAGANHALALRSDGTVWAWGLNSSGQLGNGTKTNSSTPVQVSGLSGVSQVAAGTGGSHSLAVKADGTVWAWGANSSGQLGNGTTKASLTPVQVKGLSGVSQAAAGATSSLALKANGTVWAWGANKCGQLGDGNTTASKTPAQVSGLSGVTAIAAGACGGLALESNGTVWTWGDNTYGELGDGATSTTGSPTPAEVSGLSAVSAIAAGEDHDVALQSNGAAWAWGDNVNGALGNGKTTNSTTPIQLASPTGVAVIGAGEYHTLFTRVGGTVYATGKNSSGQLGIGTTKKTLSPTLLSSLAGARALASATYTYNGDGQRATSVSAGQTQDYAWDTSGQLPLLLTDGATSYVYDDSGLPIEQISASGTVLYYHHDQLGSTRLLTTSSGAVAATFTYDAYGNLASQTGSADTPLRWAGQYQDAGTGLYYLRARYYDPTTGQFLTRDPLDEATREAYAYGAGDPLDSVDPTGLNPYSDFAEQYFPRLLQAVNNAQNSASGFVATLYQGILPWDIAKGVGSALGSLYYGAPNAEGTADFMFDTGMMLFYEGEADIASCLNDTTMMAQYQAEYQGAYAQFAASLFPIGAEIETKLEDITSWSGLIKSVLALNSFVQQ